MEDRMESIAIYLYLNTYVDSDGTIGDIKIYKSEK